MAKIIGIDLGTTNSVVAIMEGGEPTVIPSAEGERLVPSVVAVNKNHERLVGRVARNRPSSTRKIRFFRSSASWGASLTTRGSTRHHAHPYKVTKAAQRRYTGDLRRQGIFTARSLCHDPGQAEG